MSLARHSIFDFTFQAISDLLQSMGKPGYVIDDAMMIFNKMVNQAQNGETPNETLKSQLKAVLLEPFGVRQLLRTNN